MRESRFTHGPIHSIAQVQNGKLVRADALLGESLVVADGIAGFTVTQVSASETRIQVQDGRGQDKHSITLVWAQE